MTTSNVQTARRTARDVSRSFGLDEAAMLGQLAEYISIESGTRDAAAVNRLGDRVQVEQCLRRGLRAWATQGGELLRASHIADGIPTNATSLVRDMDLAPKYTWDLHEFTAEPDLYEAQVEWTPMDDAWKDLEAGNLARVFWEETQPEVARSYQPDLRLEWTALEWRGDHESRLRVSRKR